MNPNYSTYTTKRVPFVGNPDQRSTASPPKDQLFTNFFTMVQKGVEGERVFLEQRAGLVYHHSTATGTGRGIYYWNSHVWSVVGQWLYKDSTAVQLLSTTTGAVGFQEFANNVNQNFLILLDGTSGWVIKSDNTVTQITSANFPSPHQVHVGYIDSYLVVAKSGTGDLYNCNLNDPFTWTAGDFISAETFPDTVVAVCRQNNYIVAIGQQTTEYFYDTGAYPGTPLARNSAALHQIGCPAPDTVSQIEEQVLFVGQTQTGGRTVWLFNGFNPSEIGTEAVRQSIDHEGTSITSAKAFCIRSKGHKFYVLNLTSVSWVYDFETNMWHQWTDYSGTYKFNCDFASDHTTGYPLLLDRTAGYVYTLVEGVCSDATGPGTAANIVSTALTDRYDFGSMNNKFMHRLTLLCDIPAGSPATCTLYWTDDDYQTYTSGRTIPLTTILPSITQLGIFRRRAFKLAYSGVSPIRVEGFEVDINAGSQ